MRSSSRAFVLVLGSVAVPALFAACGGDSAVFSGISGGTSGSSTDAGADGMNDAGADTAGSSSTGATANNGGTQSGAGTNAAAGAAGDDDPGLGGAGGAAPCLDEDDDGETTCAGDCDDADPNAFSTNSEQCGDGTDNDCNGQADENCGGLGTYVSKDIGSANNPGTQAAPVDTIAGGIANALTILATRGSGSISVFVADGHYTEKVTLSQNVNLLGGHLCNQQTCTWQRDPSQYDSAVFATDADGMLATDAITRVTLVDGFRLMGQNGAATGRGRAALTLRNGTPTIRNNTILAPNVTGTGAGARAHGILVTNGTNQASGALIEGNAINDPGLAASPGQTNELSSGITLEQNGAQAKAAAEIRRNVIRGGQGRISTGITTSGTSDALLIDGNDIVAGSSSERSFAIQVFGAAKINDNLINVTAPVPTCGITTSWCGGIQSQSATLEITNNVIHGLNGLWSAGVYLQEAEIPGGQVILNSNTVDGTGRSANTNNSRSAGLVVWIGTCTGCGFNGFVGDVRNNILVGGTAATRVAVYEDPSPGRTQHPLSLENNLLFATSSGGGTNAIYRQMAANGTPTLLTTQNQVNQLSAVVNGMTSAGNLVGDPMLNASFHLTANSPAIGQGIATQAPSTDMDGENRPQGARDIGADEVP